MGDSPSILDAMRHVLEENAKLHAHVAAAAKERVRLRDEIHRLNNEIEQCHKTLTEIVTVALQTAPKRRTSNGAGRER
ncbi:MAG TPA: hypothetical protein VGT40_03320 [Methylomirabilota bacterium]|jgi:uncharacterized coiled-coil DUF342 family protein|nr:hypothetical protein [Methylomirabilota bacterium]